MLGDVRPEHEERRVRDQEVERHVEHQHPDPRLLDEGAPAFAELPDEPRSGLGNRLDVDLRKQKGTRRVRAGIDEQRRPGADEGDDRSAGRCSERESGVARDRKQPVRLLELVFRDDLAHEPVRGGRVEGDRRAAEALERDQLPDLSMSRE